MTWPTLFCGFAALFFLVTSARSQAIFAATETARIQAGAGGMYLKADYASNTSTGIAFWGDYDFRAFLGIEAEGRLGGTIAASNIGENSYLAGPRILYHRRRITGYGKLLGGRATITNQTLNQSSSFNVYAFGGGLEYKVTRKFNVRAIDYEIQKWPDFQPHAISPSSITIGLSYIIR